MKLVLSLSCPVFLTLYLHILPN